MDLDFEMLVLYFSALVTIILSVTPLAHAESCNSRAEAFAVNCGASFARLHFAKNGEFVLPNVTRWRHTCEEFSRFQQCTQNLSVECHVMPTISRIWSALCSPKFALQISAVDDESATMCHEIISSNKKLQNCFEKYSLDKNENSFTCDITENRFHCFATFEYLEECRQIIELYRLFYDIYRQVSESIQVEKYEKIGKTIVAPETVTIEAVSPKSSIKVETALRNDVESVTKEKEEKHQNSAKNKSSQNSDKKENNLKNKTKNQQNPTTKPKSRGTTTTKSAEKSAIKETITTPKTITNSILNVTTKPTPQTTKSTANTSSDTVKTIVDSDRVKNETMVNSKSVTATTSKTRIAETNLEIVSTKRERRDTKTSSNGKNNENITSKCSYSSIDKMIEDYRIEKEERALGGCVELNLGNEISSDFTGITIQPANNSGKDNSTISSCNCISGYKIDPQTRKCVDINECQEGTHMCSQICINRKGGYDCNCEHRYGDIYELSDYDNRTCVRRDPEPIWLVFAHGQSIWNVSVDGRFVELKVGGLEKAVMIDVDVKENVIYFVDSGKNLLEKLFLNNESTKPEIFQNYEVDGVEGIAIDYIGRNLYSARRSDIFVQSLNGEFRQRLYKNKLSTPRALVVHSTQGWLYGTDWSSEAFIYRAAMDGSHFEKIVTTNIIWPNGLALDFFASRLYWADAFLDTIQSTNFDGSDSRTIIAKSGAVAHLFGLAVADDFVFWTDWNHRAILRADKHDGKNVTILAQTTLLPYGIKVVHDVAQPTVKNVKNPCSELNCSHMCLIRPNHTITTGSNSSASFYDIGAICACASGYVLETDGRTCRALCRDSETNVLVCGGSEPRCINRRYVCDGILHCPDRMDEKNCPLRVCPLGEFQCADEPTHCIDAAAVCNGQRDCRDSSDERFCDASLTI